MLAKINGNRWGWFNDELMELFNDFSQGFTHSRKNKLYSQLSIKNNKKDIEVTLPIPGCSAKDLELEVVSDFMTVKAKREIKELGDEEKYLYRERSCESIEQSFHLPAKVDGSKAKAKLKNGILTVTMPKLEQDKPRRIEVK